MQVAPSSLRRARICSPMADISFKLESNWTSNAILRNNVIAATDKEEQQLDFDEAGPSRYVNSAGCWFLPLCPSDVPTWQEFVSKVRPTSVVCLDFKVKRVVAFGH